MLQRLFHVNICVSDMERSIKFYQDLGFTKINDFTLDDPSVGDALASFDIFCRNHDLARLAIGRMKRRQIGQR